MSNQIIKRFAANITYSGCTYNTVIHVEYVHTGKIYYQGKRRSTSSEEIYKRWMSEGKKVTVNKGFYCMKRIAVPTINAKGEKDIWYINNSGDNYSINKVSKYGKKIHAELLKEQAPQHIKK